jgi:hypothetical protein
MRSVGPAQSGYRLPNARDPSPKLILVYVELEFGNSVHQYNRYSLAVPIDERGLARDVNLLELERELALGAIDHRSGFVAKTTVRLCVEGHLRHGTHRTTKDTPGAVPATTTRLASPPGSSGQACLGQALALAKASNPR